MAVIEGSFTICPNGCSCCTLCVTVQIDAEKPLGCDGCGDCEECEAAIDKLQDEMLRVHGDTGSFGSLWNED